MLFSRFIHAIGVALIKNRNCRALEPWTEVLSLALKCHMEFKKGTEKTEILLLHEMLVDRSINRDVFYISTSVHSRPSGLAHILLFYICYQIVYSCHRKE